MCEFCHKHGEGKKWYLQAKNYSEDLLSDLKRRNFLAGFNANSEEISKAFEKLAGIPKKNRLLRNLLTSYSVARMKKMHYGQVVPIEDIETILGFVNSVVRIECICRKSFLKTEQRYCYGVSLGPNGGELFKFNQGVSDDYKSGPYAKGLEILTKEEALANFRNYEQEGLCHTVWTFVTPFIAGICNCDRADCGAMKATFAYNFPMLFRAEYVAESNPDLCVGCRECMRVCQFGAMGYSAANQKIVIDQSRCYGCGICRSSCNAQAIELRERRDVPAAADLW
jgi:ferredoxin